MLGTFHEDLVLHWLLIPDSEVGNSLAKDDASS